MLGIHVLYNNGERQIAAVITDMLGETSAILTLFHPDGTIQKVGPCTQGDAHTQWNWPQIPDHFIQTIAARQPAQDSDTPEPVAPIPDTNSPNLGAAAYMQAAAAATTTSGATVTLAPQAPIAQAVPTLHPAFESQAQGRADGPTAPAGAVVDAGALAGVAEMATASQAGAAVDMGAVANDAANAPASQAGAIEDTAAVATDAPKAPASQAQAGGDADQSDHPIMGAIEKAIHAAEDMGVI